MSAPFLQRWIVANALAELLGLGAVAAAGYGVVAALGEPATPAEALAFAALFTGLGAVEGGVVGLAQAHVLRRRLPALTGWARATVIGAVVAWAAGMVPSTLMSIAESGSSTPPPAISDALQIVLAAGLGLIAGPLLAIFQWWVLRRHLGHRALWWLPANGAAWTVGMPVIFAGAHLGALLEHPLLIALVVAMSLLAAGALVGAIHGRILVALLASERGAPPAG